MRIKIGHNMATAQRALAAAEVMEAHDRNFSVALVEHVKQRWRARVEEAEARSAVPNADDGFVWYMRAKLPQGYAHVVFFRSAKILRHLLFCKVITSRCASFADPVLVAVNAGDIVRVEPPARTTEQALGEAQRSFPVLLATTAVLRDPELVRWDDGEKIRAEEDSRPGR